MALPNLEPITHEKICVTRHPHEQQTYLCYFNHDPVPITQAELSELREYTSVEVLENEQISECLKHLQDMSAKVWPEWGIPFEEQKADPSQRLKQMDLLKAWKCQEQVELKLNQRPELSKQPLSKIVVYCERLAQKNIQHLQKQKACAVKKIYLTSLPSSFIRCFQNIKVLDLSHNRLVSLPAEIGELKQLKKLELKANAIAYFPTSVKQLKKLKFVNLFGNASRVFPLNIECIPNLTKLFLCGSFKKVPERFYQMQLTLREYTVMSYGGKICLKSS